MTAKGPQNDDTWVAERLQLKRFIGDENEYSFQANVRSGEPRETFDFCGEKGIPRPYRPPNFAVA